MKKRDKYFLLERKDSDLPFYNGYPTKIGGFGWFVILTFTFLGFVYLSIGYLPFLPPTANHYVNAIMLPLLSILGLRLVVGNNWRAIFKKPRLSDLLIIPIFTGISLFVAMFMGGIVSRYFPMAENPASVILAQPQGIMFYINSMVQDVFQLFGEELIAIIPMLFVFHLLYNKTNLGRKSSLVIALVASSLLFGMFHLPTYQWNWAQCLLVIGFSRIADTIPYIITRNIGVSFAIHYIYDFILFSAPLFFGD